MPTLKELCGVHTLLKSVKCKNIKSLELLFYAIHFGS